MKKYIQSILASTMLASTIHITAGEIHDAAKEGNIDRIRELLQSGTMSMRQTISA